MKKDFQSKTSEAELLKFNLGKAEDTLKQAQMLLGKLSGEKDRWEEQIAKLSHDLDMLPVNTLLSAAFITYLTSESEDVRETMQQVRNAMNPAFLLATTPAFYILCCCSQHPHVIYYEEILLTDLISGSTNHPTTIYRSGW